MISISYGVCEATAKPASAARTLFDREAAAIDALGITIVVAAGDSGSSACAHGVQAIAADQLRRAEVTHRGRPSRRGCSPLAAPDISLTPSNTIASSGVWNDEEFPAPYGDHRRGWWRCQYDGEAPVVADRGLAEL